MTKEEKDLLILDLNSRIPHTDVKVYCDVNGVSGTWKLLEFQNLFREARILMGALTKIVSIDKIKPYLRPLYSMTKEEAEKFYKVTGERFTFYPGCKIYDHIPAFDNDCTEFDTFNDDSEYKRVKPEHVISCIDFLNSHLFDYRELITKGLALEASNIIYKL